VTRHGRRGGCHARSPRVATRGFLGHTCQPPPQRTTRVTTTIGPPVSRPQRTTRVTTTKSPRRKPGDSGSYPFPRAMRSGFETPDAHEARGMDNGVVVIPGVPGLPPGASWDTRVIPHHNGPPVSRPQSTTRVTATKSPRRKPGDSGSYAFPRAMRSGFETPDAHEARGMDGGWLSCPESPGCHPGLPGTVAG